MKYGQLRNNIMLCINPLIKLSELFQFVHLMWLHIQVLPLLVSGQVKMHVYIRAGQSNLVSRPSTIVRRVAILPVGEAEVKHQLGQLCGLDIDVHVIFSKFVCCYDANCKKQSIEATRL